MAEKKEYVEPEEHIKALAKIWRRGKLGAEASTKKRK